jgi:hypothetical protein
MLNDINFSVGLCQGHVVCQNCVGFESGRFVCQIVSVNQQQREGAGRSRRGFRETARHRWL